MKQATNSTNLSKAGNPKVFESQLESLPEPLKKVYKTLEKSGDVPFPKKYYAAQKILIQTELHQLWEKQPEAPLKDIVATIVQNLPSFIPGHRILELTQFTIDEWQKLAKEAPATL